MQITGREACLTHKKTVVAARRAEEVNHHSRTPPSAAAFFSLFSTLYNNHLWYEEGVNDDSFKKVEKRKMDWKEGGGSLFLTISFKKSVEVLFFFIIIKCKYYSLLHYEKNIIADGEDLMSINTARGT